MIAIIDYGLGNAQAFHDIYRRLGIPAILAHTASDLDDATHIILPGVGAFDWAMSRLASSGMRCALDSAVLGRRIPVLGVCVGMQILAHQSEEGTLPGLGWIPGAIKLLELPTEPGKARLPHMGWNDVKPISDSVLFRGLGNQPRFYFLHSYYFVPSEMQMISAIVHYHNDFACAVSKDHIHGVQFHPEKSHDWGVTLLQNFAGA